MKPKSEWLLFTVLNDIYVIERFATLLFPNYETFEEGVAVALSYPVFLSYICRLNKLMCTNEIECIWSSSLRVI